MQQHHQMQRQRVNKAHRTQQTHTINMQILAEGHVTGIGSG
jgi:hypothetical protein